MDSTAAQHPPSRPIDTSAEAWHIVQERLKALSVARKVELANALSIDSERLARAGIAAMEPEASEDRIRYILAKRLSRRPRSGIGPSPSG